MTDSDRKRPREGGEDAGGRRPRKSRFSDGPGGPAGFGGGAPPGAGAAVVGIGSALPGGVPAAAAPSLGAARVAPPPPGGALRGPPPPGPRAPPAPFGGGNGLLRLPPGQPPPPPLGAPPPPPPLGLGADTPAARAAHAAAVQAQVAAQIEGVAGALEAARREKAARKARDFSIKLDEQGREVDASGAVVKTSLAAVKTVKANIDGERFSNNPYLEKAKKDTIAADPRLKERSRDRRAARSFKFVATGTYVKQGEVHRNREARKAIAGYLSGRNPNARNKQDIAEIAEDDGTDANLVEVGSRRKQPPPPGKEEEPATLALPPAPDFGDPPAVEWWDEPFFPEADRRAVRRGHRGWADLDPAGLRVEHARTWNLVQHPVHCAPAGGGGAGARAEARPVPVYLTKKERKRLRRQARLEREREKQDKIALGLMQPPEPKMKLSNFMKVIGEQAVADPSKVEKLVTAQVRARERNHEMRNQARKLTPQERKDKKRQKAMEDGAAGNHVAVFRVRDLSDPQKRFKVDVNAQQHYLTGGVLLCKEDAAAGAGAAGAGGAGGCNLVVVEGGPKAVKKFTKLMTRRIKWGLQSTEDDNDDSDDSEDEEGGGGARGGGAGARGANECRLVWTGTVAKKAFQSFRFQECKTAETARKVMEAKGVAHYWDMVINDSSAPTDAF